jgi:transcriptional regulator with XRE-family HTH domain
MAPSPAESLGREIRRLRTEANVTLRKFAESVGISAPHLSDIEHDRRRPSEKVLRKIADALHHRGATFESLDQFNTKLEPDIQEWIAEHPAARQMLRTILQSKQNPREVLRKIEDLLAKKAEKPK